VYIRLFTLKHVTDFLLVQIYVDDIIFDGCSHTLMSKFQKMLENKFQMSMMGELTFFLGIQVKQTKEDIFIHQAKSSTYHRQSSHMDNYITKAYIPHIITASAQTRCPFKLWHQQFPIKLSYAMKINKSQG
jgi:hypothetical protein